MASMVKKLSGRPIFSIVSGGKRALVAHVVDREDHGHALERFVTGILRSQKHGNQRRLPVVAMDYVGHPDAFAEFDGRAAKLGKALRVVRIILPRDTVRLIPIEVFGSSTK